MINSETNLQVGFLGYRDYSDAVPFLRFPFNVDPLKLKEYLESVKADGGGDTAEDVIGAFEKINKWFPLATNLCSNLVFLICDAPCHGK
jgi:hypothetical protein